MDDNGNVEFVIDHLADNPVETPVLNITRNNASSTDVTFTASAIDGYSADEAAELMQHAVYRGTATGDDTGTEAAGTTEGNGTNFTVKIDEQGNVTTSASDITQATADLAVLSLMAWRNETTTITDRMASLRTNPKDYGTWVRWNAGTYEDDDRKISNDFNTIEVGGDIKVAPDWVIGASFSYTKGNGDFTYGSTDSDTYAGAFYALWTHEKGSFIDMVMKAGRISSDFAFRNIKGGAKDKGALDQTGFIVSIETGHRFELPHNMFVEPQVQVQYSRLSGVSETTSTRHVDLQASDSFIGRIGVMAGLNCPNDFGTLWFKASALRDFRGDVDVDGTVALRDGSSPYAISEELDQNWAELALGANIKVTDNLYAFVDVQKSFDGNIELDWRANVGVKLAF